MRQPLVAGNWKMHGSLALVDELVGGIVDRLAGERLTAEVAVMPPFVYLPEVRRLAQGSALAWGAQDVADSAEQGAYTGEVAAGMLAELGCRYAIVGHSERRQLYGETDERVAAKFLAAHAGGLIPIVCVGETLDQREAERTEAVVGAQLEAVLNAGDDGQLARTVIAYEPVWAIGTGRTATPEQAQAMHAFIRDTLARRDAKIADSVRILYGGSVKAANAKELLSQPDVDGGLIGGASLKLDEMTAICRAAG